MFNNITKFSQSLWPFSLTLPAFSLKNSAFSKSFRPQIESLEGRWNPSAIPTMVIDANEKGNGSSPILFQEINNRLLVFADDGIHGSELWSTDGTERGTTLLKDINQGPNGTEFHSSVIFNKNLFLILDHGEKGKQLWKSDGTADGTIAVRDLYPVGDSRYFGEMVVFNNNIFFVTSNFSKQEFHLWISDGTRDGTKVIKKFEPNQSEYFYYNFNIYVTKNDFYFSIRNNLTDYQDYLWRSNGTTEGTVLVTDQLRINQVNVLNDSLIISGYDQDHGLELWRTDGTREGTKILFDFLPGIDSSNTNLIGVNHGEVYFTAITNLEGSVGFWKTDGTQTGTQIIKQFDSNFSWDSRTGALSHNGSLFFMANHTDSGNELWKSDGTPEGTGPVKDIVPGPGGSNPINLISNGDSLYFFDTPAGKLEIWKTDGTSEGTIPFLNQSALPSSGYLDLLFSGGLFFFQGNMLFTAENEIDGPELWKSDGTPQGTVQVKNIRTLGTQASFPREFFKNGDYLLYWASDGSKNLNLFATIQGIAVHLGSFENGTIASQFTSFLGQTWFIINDSTGTGLWKTDGTLQGTGQIAKLGKQRANGNGWLIAFRDSLFFTVDDGLNGQELWKSDGTTEGTVLFKDIFPGPESSIDPEAIPIEWNGVIYFLANDGEHGSELWRSDGTETGTRLVKDINPGMDGSYVSELTQAGGFLYFAASNATTGRKLWRSDGTEEGTVFVPYIDPSQDYQEPKNIGQIGDTIFFYAKYESGFQYLHQIDKKTGSADYFKNIYGPITGFIPFRGKYLFIGLNPYFDNGQRLDFRIFITDGSYNNTIPIKNLRDDIGFFNFDYTISDNNFYFWNDGLWKTDGTIDGTILIKKFEVHNSNLTKSLFAFDHKVYFRVIDSKGDIRGPFTQKPGVDTLWVTDGTFAGTKPIAQFFGIQPSPYSGNLYEFKTVNLSGSLFFSANDGIHGNELFRLNPENVQPLSTLPLRGLEGSFDGFYPDWQSNFVAGLYKTILNRPAAKQDLRHWVGLLTLGMTRNRVAQALLESPEYRGIQVDSYYQRFLGRQADTQGRRAWISQLLSGVPEGEVISRFLTSAEYLNRFADNGSFLQGVYQNLLGRSASVSEIRHWDELLNGRLNRNQVIRLIVHSEEAISNEIQSLYNNFLHRDMDAQGRVMVKRVVQQKSSFKEILKGIFSSPEFHHLTPV